MHRRTWATIDLDAIRANYAYAASLAPQARNVAVIKADAYGHGMLAVAEALADVAPAFAVATLDEALALRGAGVDKTLLVLEGAAHGDAWGVARERNLTLMLHQAQQAKEAARAAVPLWIKVDTGMHRLGIAPDELAGVLGTLHAGGAAVQAVCTHLACADEPGGDATRLQLEAFAACTSGLGLPLSIANSAGIMAWPDSHADWNRPGYMLYGGSPFACAVEAAVPLRPAMSFVSEIIAIRDVAAGESIGYGARWTAQRASRIATIAAGYADGYPRHAANGTPVGIAGGTAPLVGTVSMDMITVDVTERSRATVGDSVELWGETVPVDEVAACAGTIGYELLTGVSARVPRRY